MLYFLLIASAFLLVVTNRFAYRSNRPAGRITIFCLVCAFGQLCLGFLVPLVSLEALLLILALGVWQRSGRGPEYFRSLSLGSAGLVLAMATVIALRSEWDYERLRARYPYQSMEGRVPLLPVSAVARPPKPEVEDRLERLESRDGFAWFRDRRLQKLHEDKVQLFIDSFGFGYSRMLPGPSEQNLLVHRPPVPRQPGPRVALSTSPNEWRPAQGPEAVALGQLLEMGTLDFTNPLTLGYVKDRQHVAGFEPHRFGDNPGPNEVWTVRTLDLVGLLLEAEPRVYVSEKLPSMEEVGQIPTRPLDRFEAVGLEALRDGEDLWITREGDAARMLGAIRSTKQCIACHGGRRGDLLGAFSYTLLGTETPPDNSPRRSP